MEASKFAKLLEVVVRKVVREEIKPLKKQLNELKQSKALSAKKLNDSIEEFDPLNVDDILNETKVESPRKKKNLFKSNSAVSNILNETYDEGEWRTINDGTYTTQEAIGYGNTAATPTVDPDGNPMSSKEAKALDDISKKFDFKAKLKAMENKSNEIRNSQTLRTNKKIG